MDQRERERESKAQMCWCTQSIKSGAISGRSEYWETTSSCVWQGHNYLNHPLPLRDNTEEAAVRSVIRKLNPNTPMWIVGILTSNFPSMLNTYFPFLLYPLDFNIRSYTRQSKCKVSRHTHITINHANGITSNKGIPFSWEVRILEG